MNYELPSIELRVIEENNYLKFGEYLNDMPCGNTINKLSLDDLQYVKKLQEENKRLNGAIQTYDILLKANAEENKQLKDNWNKLREWLEKELGDKIKPNKDKWLTGLYDAYRETIYKMQELERSDSNE